LRTALAYSRNVPTVKLAEMVGVNSIIELARRAGIKSEMPSDLTIALGSVSLSPLELTSAYAVLPMVVKKLSQLP